MLQAVAALRLQKGAQITPDVVVVQTKAPSLVMIKHSSLVHPSSMTSSEGDNGALINIQNS